MVSFFVAGDPAPQGSKVLALRDRRGRALATPRMFDASKRLKSWRACVAQMGLVLRTRYSGLPLRTPLGARLLFVVHPSKTKTRKFYGTTDPRSWPSLDLDKLYRSTFDGLKDGGIIADDRLVVLTFGAKVYGPNAGCRVDLFALPAMSVMDTLELTCTVTRLPNGAITIETGGQP